jgi:type II secretory pathway predicted ATPase ExeA
MYEPFFGMERRPFSATPDAGCFFSSSEFQAVLDELTVCVERGQGIGILTASAGIGKTLLCQRLTANLRRREKSKSQFECVYLGNSNFPTRRSLLQAILFEMGDEYSRRDEPELRIDLRSRLLSLRPEREALVLIVDEAHLFADELLEELRIMSDIADNGSSLVRIILSGQHELEERLTDRAFDALNQRISTHVFAEPLTISESIEYVRHRLEWAGCDIEAVFTEEAVSVIARASSGVPRCLNQLSDHSLLLAFASDEKPVSEDTVREALEDLKQLPLHWNDVSDGTAIVGYVEEVSDDEEEDLSSELEETSGDHVSSDAFAAQAKALSGIVESLLPHTAESVKTDSQPAVSPLDNGIELDFSSGIDDASPDDANTDESDDADDQTVAASHPETAVFEFAGNESTTSNTTDDVENHEPFDADETLIQVLRPAIQETLFESRNGRRMAGKISTESSRGLSFQITSNGFELDDFGPPEELNEHPAAVSIDEDATDTSAASDKEEQQPESGVIEFAFDDESSNETDADTAGESADKFHAEAARTVSAAEITAELLGQDSVLSDFRHDAVVEDPVPESDELFSEVAESADLAEAAPCEFSEHEELVVNKVQIDDSGHEEELVFDPYAALQEPESAGIVWNVSSFSKWNGSVTEAKKTSEPIEYFATAEIVEAEFGDDTEAAANCATSEETAVEFSFEDSDEPIDFDGGLILDDGDVDDELAEVALSLSIAEEESAAHEPGEVIQESPAMMKADAPLAETAEETETAEEFEEASAEGIEQFFEVDFATHDDETTSEVVEEPFAVEEEEDSDAVVEQAEFMMDGEYGFTLAANDDEHDVVQPEDIRPLRPSRLIDSLIPLLDELDSDLDSVNAPEHAGRSVMDIEAELILEIDHDNDDLEDQIGATMLDICLDTQSALQESAAAIRNAKVTDENDDDLDDAHDEMPEEPLDVVQPEPRGREESSSYKLDQHFGEPSSEGSTTNTQPAPKASSIEKPFGRLFSDLRRRKS